MKAKIRLKPQLFQNKIHVKKSSMHGYGVFAGKALKKGEIIEECYFILSKGGDDVIQDFYFDAKGRSALFLGFGSIYNHAEKPNADYNIKVKKRLAVIKAKRDIKKGEEIFVSYGDKWFSSRGWEAKSVEHDSSKKPKKKTKAKRRTKAKSRTKAKRRTR